MCKFYMLKLFLILSFIGMEPLLAEPPPKFSLDGTALNPDRLSWIPTGELEHPAFIKVEGLIDKPLGKYYLYYSPHKHHGIGLAYSDSLDGPWKEFEKNPVIEGPAAPDIRWIEDKKKFYMWGHYKNSQTEVWTSDDGISFEYKGVSIKASNIGTKNATYTRFYQYPLEKYGSKYIMLYSGFIKEKGVRCIWLAYSNDAENWTQLKTPLVEPIDNENKQLFGPALFRWKNRNYIIYADATSWRGGNLKYVGLDRNLSPVGQKGERRMFMKPPEKLSLRYRAPEFYLEDGSFHMISGGGKSPRIYIKGSAIIDSDLMEKEQ